MTKRHDIDQAVTPMLSTKSLQGRRRLIRPPGSLLLLLLLALPVCAETYVPPVVVRTNVNLDAGWRFIRQDVVGAQANNFDDSSWTNLNLPHTWNNHDGQDGGGNYYRGIGWYRTHYIVGATNAGRRFFLKFDGANTVTDVYVNGAAVGQHLGGYAAFAFDVTSNLLVGADNVIAVKVNNAYHADLPPRTADFTFFGGLYRSAHLLVTDPLHISPLDYGSSGVYLKTTGVSSNSATLQVTTVVSNSAAVPKTARLRVVVTDAATNIVVTMTNVVTLAQYSGANVVVAATISNPRLWNGRADPYRYRAFVEIGNGARATDLVEQPLGFRYYRVDPTNGFFLNGRHQRIHGVCLHQDWQDKGWALGDAERLTNFALLKEMGVTAVRLAHYQHAAHTYDLADRDGVMLWTEIPLVDSVNQTLAFTNNARAQLIELIRQNYNHPAVLFWGLFNEESSAATRLVGYLQQVAEQEDSTRPTVAASHLGNGAALNWISDTIGFNKYYGWYGGDFDSFGAWADKVHSSYPTNLIGVGEYGAGASVRQHSENPVAHPVTTGAFHPQEWQNLFHESHWQQIKARPFLWGTFVWNMFDFAMDSRSEGDTIGRNDKGLVTYDRLIRKDAFYFYQANWTTNPMVHITGHTFTNRLTNAITAKVYANCDSVELFLNGATQGARSSTNFIFTWPLTLAGGTNNVHAIGTKNSSNVTDSLIWMLPLSR